MVRQFVQAAGQLDPSTPEWRMSISKIMDVLNKHVMDEEGQIFGRIEQVWDTQRLEQAGQRMQKMKNGTAHGGTPRIALAKSAKRRRVEASSPPRRTR